MDSSPGHRTRRLQTAGAIVSRATALWLGLFSLANLTVGLHDPTFDANQWWIDLRPIPAAVANFILIMIGVCLLLHAFSPRVTGRDRPLLAIALSLLGLICIENVLHFYWLVLRGDISSGFPLPFSLFVLAGILIMILTARYQSISLRGKDYVATMALVIIFTSLFPLTQMWCFGKTDYRRSGDVAVVFGSRVYADGQLSQALMDRVRTACKLYSDGVVSKIIFSGGPGDGDIHETQAMQRVAIELSVAPADILLDPEGLNTRATVRNTCRMFRKHGFRRVLAVSHFYHLPRIKLSYQRAGQEVYTVPADETRTLTLLPYYMLREVAAFWYYYTYPLIWPGHPIAAAKS